MKLLLHICCGPCACHPLEVLREEGHEVTGYFYNPNIHPYQEWVKRRQGVEQLAASADLSVIYDRNYDIQKYFHDIAFREERRCYMCYNLRLNQTAHIAQKGNFDGFTTSLLVSPYQKHDLIKEAALAAAERYGVEFVYRDFRPGFKSGQQKARELELYRQQYCGCLYSEVERYAPKEHWPLGNRRGQKV